MSAAARHRWQKELDLLLEHPDGMIPSELSQELGVSRQTIHNDLKHLFSEAVRKVEGTSRYAINARDYLRPMRLSLPHVWLLYLLLRRVVRANLHQDTQFSSLLYRLAALLHEEIADYLVPLSIPQKSGGSATFTNLVEAWREERCVDVRYQPLFQKDVSCLTIAPWWFEPAVWSDSLYLIGGLPTKAGEYKPITLKLERIHSVRITSESFRRPTLKASWICWR